MVIQAVLDASCFVGAYECQRQINSINAILLNPTDQGKIVVRVERYEITDGQKATHAALSGQQPRLQGAGLAVPVVLGDGCRRVATRRLSAVSASAKIRFPLENRIFADRGWDFRWQLPRRIEVLPRHAGGVSDVPTTHSFSKQKGDKAMNQATTRTAVFELPYPGGNRKAYRADPRFDLVASDRLSDATRSYFNWTRRVTESSGIMIRRTAFKITIEAYPAREWSHRCDLAKIVQLVVDALFYACIYESYHQIHEIRAIVFEPVAEAKVVVRLEWAE